MLAILEFIMVLAIIVGVIFVLVVILLNFIEWASRPSHSIKLYDPIKSGINKVDTNKFFRREIIGHSSVFELDNASDNPFLSFQDIMGITNDYTLHISAITPVSGIYVSVNHAMGVSFDINTVKPIKSYFMDVNSKNVFIKSQEQSLKLSDDRSIFISDSSITNLEVSTNVKLTVSKSHFDSIQLSGFNHIDLSSCDARKATINGTVGSTLAISFCKIYDTKISGPFEELSIRWSDLYMTKFSDIDEDTQISIYGCIGNGTTVQHLNHGKVFINWTSAKVFFNTTTECYGLSINDTDTIFDVLTDITDGPDAAFILDYIIDHPAEPFGKGESNG